MTNTHDYTKRGWGHDFVIHDVIDKGASLRLSGWGRGLTDGDFIVLPNGEATTRYRLREVSYKGDPQDMWSAHADFAPRAAALAAAAGGRA